MHQGRNSTISFQQRRTLLQKKNCSTSWKKTTGYGGGRKKMFSRERERERLNQSVSDSEGDYRCQPDVRACIQIDRGNERWRRGNRRYRRGNAERRLLCKMPSQMCKTAVRNSHRPFSSKGDFALRCHTQVSRLQK
mmetsp:Transcript_12536/g.24378  ORF Transcript_12536/g.24378 Transcript_12536/m.24378 type:complete len:136 (-) Transcript_12536:2623-3030(-)